MLPGRSINREIDMAAATVNSVAWGGICFQQQ